jgi:hypothetical protein
LKLLFETKQIIPLLLLEKGMEKGGHLGESHDPLEGDPLINTDNFAVEMQVLIKLIHFSPKPVCLIICFN